MTIYHLRLVDGWIFEIPISVKLHTENEQDINEFVLKVENEGLDIINQVLESFSDVFRVTTINKPTPIFPRALSNKDFINGTYNEQPIEKENVIKILQDYINQKDQKDYFKLKSRLGAIMIYGAYRLIALDKNQKPIDKWILRTSEETKSRYNEPVDMFEITYWSPTFWPDILRAPQAGRMHDVFISLYSDDFFEYTEHGPRINDDLKIAQKNRENLLSCLKTFQNKYSDSNIFCLPAETIWKGIDYLPFPGPVHERNYI